MDALIPEGALRAAILGRLQRKSAGDEVDRGPAIPELDDFLASELVRLQAGTATPPASGTDIDVARLDALLWDCVMAGQAAEPAHRDEGSWACPSLTVMEGFPTTPEHERYCAGNDGERSITLLDRAPSSSVVTRWHQE